MSYFFAIGVAPPPPAVPTQRRGGGGTFFPRYLNRTLLSASLARTQTAPVPVSSWFLLPNEYDQCLAKDYQLYLTINRELLSCAKRPACFLIEERAWVDQPAGAIVFNPEDALPLPAPAAGLVSIFSFRVPFGYDGVILGQYHAFTQDFNEGSGDLTWRIRANGRYLRDTGNMRSTIGTSRTVSPCPGGLWVQSGNLIEYLVDAPNTGGSLPFPGVGNVLAGLHGYFYPRK